MSYIQKAIDKLRDLPNEADGIVLWEFPEADFDAYRSMPDTPPLESYGHYLAALAAIQADVERTGRYARRVRVPVAAILGELARQNWPNDAQHRTKVIGVLAADCSG